MPSVAAASAAVCGVIRPAFCWPSVSRTTNLLLAVDAVSVSAAASEQDHRVADWAARTIGEPDGVVDDPPTGLGSCVLIDGDR